MNPALVMAATGAAVGAALLAALVVPATPELDLTAPAHVPVVPDIRDSGRALHYAAQALSGVDDPGARFAAEEGAFLAGGLDTLAAPIPAVVSVPQGPSPPDMSYAIGTAVAAIDRSTGRAELILAEGGGNRRLATGGEYRDGWRLAGVDGQTILLSRGREKRRVDIRYGPPDPVPMTLAALVVSGPQLPPGMVPPDPDLANPDLARVATQGLTPPPRRLLRRPGKT